MNSNKPGTIKDTRFTREVVMHTGSADITGINSASAFYAFLPGFSDIQFTIKDLFGQGDKLKQYRNLKGTHTGDFFCIAAAGKSVNLDGTTLVRLSNGKTAEEKDFFDRPVFMSQPGLIPASEN